MQDQLNSYFRYEDGKLFHKESHGRAKKGSEAGTAHNLGYCNIQVAGTRYYRHRIVWTMHYGEIPEGFVVDHINGIKGDDRIENLRCVTQKQNLDNHWGRTLPKGVYKRGQKYRARLVDIPGMPYVGTHDTVEQALEAISQSLELLRQ